MKRPPGYIIIGKRENANAYAAGIVENSFSMSVHPERSNFWWIGSAVSNFGTKHELTREKVFKNAEHYRDMFSKPGDPKFEIWDVDDPNLPVEIDWQEWERASAPSDKTLSGVVNKFRARNVRFKMKE